MNEKIVWIDSYKMLSGDDNDFQYDIGNIQNNSSGKYNVELLKAYITYNRGDVDNMDVGITFNALLIKIYINFSSSSNCFGNSVYGLLMGVINCTDLNFAFQYDAVAQTDEHFFYSTPIKKAEEFNDDNPIKYTLYEKPNNLIDVRICDESDALLKDKSNPSISPDRVLLCLKFTW